MRGLPREGTWARALGPARVAGQQRGVGGFTHAWCHLLAPAGADEAAVEAAVEAPENQAKISASVFDLPSLSLVPLHLQRPSFRRREATGTGDLPGPGDLVAIDTEFVSVSDDDTVINADGSKTVGLLQSQELWGLCRREGFFFLFFCFFFFFFFFSLFFFILVFFLSSHFLLLSSSFVPGPV